MSDIFAPITCSQCGRDARGQILLGVMSRPVLSLPWGWEWVQTVTDSDERHLLCEDCRDAREKPERTCVECGGTGFGEVDGDRCPSRDCVTCRGSGSVPA